MEVKNLWIHHGAIVDESMIVLVGAKNNGEEVPPRVGDPNGVIADLDKKTFSKFTNGHKGAITSVSVSRGRIATTSDHSDPVLRVWDMKAGKRTAIIEIEHRDEGGPDYSVAWLVPQE